MYSKYPTQKHSSLQTYTNMNKPMGPEVANTASQRWLLICKSSPPVPVFSASERRDLLSTGMSHLSGMERIPEKGTDFACKHDKFLLGLRTKQSYKQTSGMELVCMQGIYSIFCLGRKGEFAESKEKAQIPAF